MSDIVVHVDFRETELLEMLRLKCTGHGKIKVDSQNLDVGDIVIANGLTEQPYLVLERKTLADLASSNRDGRYREQRARLLSLKGQGIAIGYLIEVGPGWSAELNRVWPGNVPETTLLSIITRLQIRFGIPVIISKDAAISKGLIFHLASQISEDNDVFAAGTGLAADATVAAAAYTEALSAQKSANRGLKRTAAGMLCAIPGIGAKLSEGILDACDGTLEGVMKKSLDELTALKVGKRSVGKVAAEKIWTALHSK
jgi:ERCC4-type nuclease